LAAHGLASLIDGLWLRAALSGQPFNLETARTLTTRFIRQQLAGAAPHEKEE
ncbi:TetR family transcriptional regulator C-terminal domain-containing protein, partial [Cronobacter sakazakii]